MNRISFLCAAIKYKSTMLKVAKNYDHSNICITLTENCGAITKPHTYGAWHYTVKNASKSLIIAATQTSPMFIKQLVRRHMKVNSVPAFDNLKNHRVDLQSALPEDVPINFMQLFYMYK